jgi:hypothetical protein
VVASDAFRVQLIERFYKEHVPILRQFASALALCGGESLGVIEFCQIIRFRSELVPERLEFADHGIELPDDGRERQVQKKRLQLERGRWGQRKSLPSHAVETKGVLWTNCRLGAEEDVEKVLRHERIRPHVGQLMGSAERLLPASLNKSLNLVSSGEGVLKAKIVKRGELLHEQIIVTPGVQVVAVCPFNHLRRSVPFWLPVSFAAFRRQGSACNILIHGPVRKTAVAASAGGQPSFLTDCIHVKVCSVSFATDGLVALAPFILNFFLADSGPQWRVVHGDALCAEHQGREKERER